MEIRI